MYKVLSVIFNLAALPTCRAQPPGRGGGGGGGQNVHVEFGNVADCTAPPDGSCADYSISPAQVIDSLAGFTTYNSGALAVTSFSYYGSWWASNVGTNSNIAADFCTSGGGISQVADTQAYTGITFASEGSDSWTSTSYSAPNHDSEDYCSAVGGRTPPLIGSTFTTSYSQTYTLSPSSKSRGDISNQVGYAVNGVVIFSPFTGISTVAPYDETLDTCIGHPANNKYHYHGFTPCLHGESGTQSGDSIPHSKIYGWAFDGFPIYGPYGYTDGNDTTSTVVRVTGGYTCTSGGSACTTDAQKAVATNWAYSASNGILDDCNGRWTKTLEFPEGMYVYVLNIQANGAPDFPGVPYCVQGKVDAVASSTCGSSLGLWTAALIASALLLVHSLQ